MASKFAKYTLKDLAKGANKKKDDDLLKKAEQKAAAAKTDANDSYYDAYKADKGLAKLAQEKAETEKRNAPVKLSDDQLTNQYLKDRVTANERKDKLVQAGYALYNSPKNVDKRSTSQWQLPSGAGVRDYVQTEEEVTFQRWKNDRAGIEAAGRVVETEAKLPGVKDYTEKLYSVLNDDVKTVNPFENAQNYRDKAAAMTAYGNRVAMEGEGDRERMLVASTDALAEEYTRRANIIDSPLKALKQVNDEITMLEEARSKYDVFGRGSDKRDLEDKLAQLNEQRMLLEAKTFKAPDDSWKQNAVYAGNVDRYLKGMTEEEYMKLQELSAYEPELALAYSKKVMERIDHEQQDQGFEKLQESAANNLPVSVYVNALDVMNNAVIKPMTGALTAGAHALGMDVDEYSYLYMPEKWSAAVTSGTQQGIENSVDNKWVESALKLGYNAAKGIAETALRARIQAGLGMGKALRNLSLFFSGYGSGAYGAAEKDAGNPKQGLMGILSGFNEVIWESLPDDIYQETIKLTQIAKQTGKKQPLRNFINALLKAFGVEGGGEAMTELGNGIADYLVMGSDSDINRNAQAYLVSGAAETMGEATSEAWKQLIREAGYAGLVGAFSGLGTEAVLSGGVEKAIDFGLNTYKKAQTSIKNRHRAKLEALAKEQSEAEKAQVAADLDAQMESEAQKMVEEEKRKTEEPVKGDEGLADIAGMLTPAQEEKPAAKVTVRTAAEYTEAAPKTQEMKTATANRRTASVAVTGTKDGYTINKDGAETNLEAMDADSIDAKMLATADNMSQDAANDMLALYDDKGEAAAETYAQGYKAAYEAGLRGTEYDKMDGLFVNELNEQQRMSAWMQGVQARNTENTRVEHLTRQIAKRSGFNARTTADGVSLERVTNDLSAEEKTTFALLDAFGKEYGLNIRIYDTLAEGRANASYVPGTNVVNIARDAQEGALTRAASHEVYHYLEVFSKEDAAKIKAFVLDKLRNTEGYDLDAELQKYRDRYANVEGADVEAELVADSLLDVIGTEENIKRMAKDNPNMLERILDVVKRIREFLRKQLERLANKSETAAVMLEDEKALAEIQRMVEQGLNNAKANRETLRTVSQTARQDADVQAYLADVENATDNRERANLLESLTNQVYLRTQMDVLQKTGEYEGGLQIFKDVLHDFATGKGNLNVLLKEAGLIAGQNEQDTAVMAWLARERERVGVGAMVQNSIKDNDAFEKWFADSPFKNDDGTPKVYYHGTPYGGFDTFKGWSYFTADKAYADKYHIPSASSIRGKYSEATKPETYAVYLTADKVFDTRDPAVRKVWKEQFYDHYSRTPLTDRGVPDWTDGIDLIEFFEDNDLDYDAIILDEGGTGGYGDEVQDRGLSVVVKDSSQVKSVDNVGSFDKNTGNIYWSLKDTEGVQDMRNEMRALEEEQKQLQQEQERYKATEEYKRVHEPFMAKEEGARKAYAEYLKRSGLGEVNKRMNEVRNMIFSLESKIANAELEAQVQKAEDPVRKAARLRNELGEMEMRLQEVTIKLNEMQNGKGYNDIVDAMMAGKANDDAYNQYLESSGMMKLAKEEKQLRAEIADAKRQLEEAQKQTEQQTEKTETPAFRKWFGKSQVVNDDGSPKMVYHGSSAEFDEFSYEFIGKHGSAEGQGIYFTDSVQMASGYTDGYGGKLYAGWLKIENPLSNDKKTMTRAKLKKLISMIDTDGDGIISGYARNTSDYGKPSFYQRELETTANAVYAGNANDAEMIAEIANGSGGMAYVAPYLRKLGYDGYVVKGKYTDATVYVAFESNQFKSVENVGTFDESTGNFYRSQKQYASNNWFMQSTYDRNVREAGELIEDLYRARAAIGRYEGDMVASRTWDATARNVAERLIADTGSDISVKRLTQRVKNMYQALDKRQTNIYDAMQYAGDIAAELARKVDMEDDEQSRELRAYFKEHKIYLTPEMESEVRATYGNVQNFMRKHFGKAKFTTSNPKATSLEESWGELSDAMPHIFKADAKPDEMIMTVDAFLEDMEKKRKEAYYSATISQLRADVAMELFWQYYNTPGVLPTAEKVNELKDMVLKSTNAKEVYYSQYLEMEALKMQHAEEVKKLEDDAWDAKKKYNEVLREVQYQNYIDTIELKQKLRDQMKEARDKYKLKYQERVQAFDEREKKVQQVKSLQRTGRALAKRMLKPTKQSHIPEELKPTVGKLIDIINNGGGVNGSKYEELKGMLSELKQNNADVMMNIVGGIYQKDGALDALKKSAGEKSLGRMSNVELATMRDVANNIRHACVEADNMISAGHKGKVSEIATEMHRAFETRADRKAAGDLKKTLKNLNYHLMDAPRYFRELARFAGDGARELWNIVRDAQDKQVNNLDEAAKLYEEKIGKYDYEKWKGDRAEKHLVQVEGAKIELSTGQLMSLYALNQREAARSHIYGVENPKTEELERGGIVAARTKTKDGVVEGVKPYRVTEEQVQEMFKLLTKEQKECANALVEIMSKWCSKKANEVSMDMYGIEMYNEPHYIPIDVWQGKKDVQGEEHNMGAMFSLMNKSWTNQLVEKSAEPIVISDIFDVTNKHINEVIMYNAWAATVSDMIRLMNYKSKPLTTWDDKKKDLVQWINKDFGDGSIREDIVRTMGDEAFRWMEQLIKDINGTVINKPESDVAKLANKGLRVYKTSRVMNNLRTAAKQPTSIIRAMDVIPAHYFVGKVDLSKEKLELMRKYAPIARWKDWGFFTMDTGRSTESVLMPKARKLQDKASEGAMYLAGLGDTVTWMNIWAAAERQVKAKNKELIAGTDAYYKQVAKVFNDCVDQTQTVDSILHRSELMRQNTLGVKMITTFMGEPLKSYNKLLDAYLEYKHSKSESAKYALIKGVWQFSRAAVFGALVESMLYALGKLNDDDPFWKQWMEEFAGNYEKDMSIAERAGEFVFSSLGSQLNILNYLPLARDVVERAQGYEVSRADMGAVDAFMDAAKGIFNEKASMASRIATLLGTAGDIAGYGTTNIIKEAKRIWNFINVAGEKLGMNTIPMQYALLKWEKSVHADNATAYANFIAHAREMGYDEYADDIRADLIAKGLDEENLDTRTANKIIKDATDMENVTLENTYAALGEAIRSKDKELQKLLTKELNRKGKDQETIDEGLIKWLKTNAAVMAAAEKAVAGDERAKMDMYKRLQEQGFSEAVSKAAVNRAYNAAYAGKYDKEDKAEKQETEKAVEPMYGYNDLHVAIEDNDAEGAREIIADLRTAGKSDSSIKSALTSRIKPIYIALSKGTAADKKQAKRIKQMLMSLDLENRYTEKAIDGWLE